MNKSIYISHKSIIYLNGLKLWCDVMQTHLKLAGIVVCLCFLFWIFAFMIFGANDKRDKLGKASFKQIKGWRLVRNRLWFFLNICITEILCIILFFLDYNKSVSIWSHCFWIIFFTFQESWARDNRNSMSCLLLNSEIYDICCSKGIANS